MMNPVRTNEIIFIAHAHIKNEIQMQNRDKIFVWSMNIENVYTPQCIPIIK